MIHQHFMLVPTLTVAENVALGLGGRTGSPTCGPVKQRLLEVSDQYGLTSTPTPTSGSSPSASASAPRSSRRSTGTPAARARRADRRAHAPEVDDLFATLRQLHRRRRGLIFISHKLHEVMELSDEITVLRDGRVSGTPGRARRHASRSPR